MSFGLMARCQKQDIILVIKLFKICVYQKMSINKNVVLTWYSLMKKNEKDSDDF